MSSGIVWQTNRPGHVLITHADPARLNGVYRRMPDGSLERAESEDEEPEFGVPNENFSIDSIKKLDGRAIRSHTHLIDAGNGSIGG